jgi:F0F1-type ATP synthase membrane subunit a
MAIDVFLADALASGQLKGKFVAKADHILLHGHCHQKASFGTSGMKDIYQTGTALSVMSLIVVAVAWLALSDTKSNTTTSPKRYQNWS